MTYAADAKFLRDAANHFEHQPTGGEDRAFWANIYNAANCRRIADYVEGLPASAMSARSGETSGLAPQDASATGEAGDAQTPQAEAEHFRSGTAPTVTSPTVGANNLHEGQSNA